MLRYFVFIYFVFSAAESFAHRFTRYSYQEVYQKHRYDPAVYKKMKEDKLDVRSYISFKNRADIEQKRLELNKIIFNDTELTKETPDQVKKVGLSEGVLKSENISHVEKYDLRMDHNLKVTGYIHHPKKSNGKLVLYLYGHGREIYKDETRAANDFLAKNYTVATVDMPLENLNEERR